MDLLDHIDQPQVYEQLQRPEVASAYANLRMMIAQNKRIGMLHDNNPVAQFRYLRHWAALVVGDYDKIQSLLEQSLTASRQAFATHRQELLTKAVSNPPAGYGNDQLHRDLTLLAKDDQITALQALILPALLRQGNLALLPYCQVTSNAVFRYFELLTELGEAHVRLALVYMEQGDIATAKFHFVEATKLPSLPVEPPALRLAKRYLKSIP
jgi:hypothetical protein